MSTTFRFHDQSIAALKADVKASKGTISISDQTLAALQGDIDRAEPGSVGALPWPLVVQLVTAIVDEKLAGLATAQPNVSHVVAPSAAQSK